MTDNEIIKAFKDFLNEQVDGYTDHVETGGERYEFIEKELELLKETDNLINRLQAKLDEAEDTIQFADKELKKANTEIERLKSDVSVSKDAYMSMKDRYEYEKEKVEKAKQKCIGIAKALKTAKAEAYKEFAERLKAEMLKSKYNITTSSYSRACNAVIDFWVEEIDNLLKELVGEQNG